MGHTLVTGFSAEDLAFLNSLTAGTGANKIPFGRDCDRTTANGILDYHVTLAHWSRNSDVYYLKLLENYRFTPCRIRLDRLDWMRAEENSTLLYFSVSPDEGFGQMAQNLEQTLQIGCSSFLHMTLAVDHSYERVMEIAEIIRERIRMPHVLNVTGLDLYHIWRPIHKVKTFTNETENLCCTTIC